MARRAGAPPWPAAAPRRRGWRRRSVVVIAPGPASSSDSGPAAGAVWSTIRPSRRKTTRSAQEASCASWVTTTPATPPWQRLADQPHHRLAVDRVQRAGRLVGQQQAPLADDRAGDRHPLPLAAGQLVGEPVGPLGQPEPVQRGQRRRPRAARADMPSSSSGSDTFSAAVSPASRLKSWKT